MIVVSHRSFCPKRLVASEAFICLLVSLNIFSSHDHGLLDTENGADIALFVIKPLQESVNNIVSLGFAFQGKKVEVALEVLE